jgi:putative tricarboxylic transport membrane protein
MKYGNFWSGIFFLGTSIFICIESFRFGLGRWSEPGAGFLPFGAGVILACFSLFLVIEAVYKASSIPGVNPLEKIRWRKWLLTLLSLLGYSLLLEPLGFILCTLIFMIILLAFVEPQRWTIVFAVPTITTVVAYIIFQWMLKAQLPAGILGF